MKLISCIEKFDIDIDFTLWLYLRLKKIGYGLIEIYNAPPHPVQIKDPIDMLTYVVPL